MIYPFENIGFFCHHCSKFIEVPYPSIGDRIFHECEDGTQTLYIVQGMKKIGGNVPFIPLFKILKVY